jgi:hypothetical protein
MSLLIAIDTQQEKISVATEKGLHHRCWRSIQLFTSWFATINAVSAFCNRQITNSFEI